MWEAFRGWVYVLAGLIVIAVVALLIAAHVGNGTPTGNDSNANACSAFDAYFAAQVHPSSPLPDLATVAQRVKLIALGRKAQNIAIQVAVNDWTQYDPTVAAPQDNIGFAEYAEACDALNLGSEGG